MRTYAEYENPEVFELASTIRVVSKALERSLNTTSSTIFFQEYKDGGDNKEKIEHFHVHIVPRVLNDFQKTDELNQFLLDHDKEYSN